MSIVLENSAHSKKALGGDIADLYYIRSRLDQPERVSFCLDTAHAYVYGYSIHQDLDLWLNQVDTLLSGAISLLHLNDTTEPLGSHNDRHAFIGQGLLGAELLKRCALHPVLSAVPIILASAVNRRGRAGGACSGAGMVSGIITSLESQKKLSLQVHKNRLY